MSVYIKQEGCGENGGKYDTHNLSMHIFQLLNGEEELAIASTHAVTTEKSWKVTMEN